jgi:hypothetical protein
LHTLVTFVAEPKSGLQEIGTRSNSDLIEGMMFSEEGENGLTLGRFWSFYFHPLILRNCVEIWVLSPFFFEDDPYTHDSQRILRGSVCLSTPFLDG